MISEHHSKILEGRGLDTELLGRLGIESSSQHGTKQDWIVIPYYHGDEVCNRKFRTISGEKRFHQEPDREPRFYNENVIGDEHLKGQPLIITEGEIDCWAALQSGFARVVSVPNGAPAKEGSEGDRYRFLEHAPKQLSDCREIILASDSDAPGVALMNDLALRLGRARCKWVKYPQGCKDLGDALKKFGPRGVVEVVNQALWFQVDGLYSLSELPPLADLRPFDSGFPGMATHYKLREGDLAIFTGVPGSGKTTAVNDVACRMAMHHHWRAVFASFEQVAQRDHRRFLRTWYNAKLEVHQNPEEISKADAWINEYFRFIVPGDDDDPTLEYVLERLSTAVIRYGAKLCIIDPWNELDHERPEAMSMTDYIGHSLRILKRFARKHGVHLIVVAHPQKLRRDQNGRWPMPCLYDIADSAHWKNRCDVGVVVHRETDKATLVRVEKVRYHEDIGKPGDFYVHYDWQRATFDAANKPEK